MLSFLVCHELHHFCGFDKEMVNYTIKKESLISERSLKSGASWKPIRIFFDYRYLDGTRYDSKMCTRVGQEVIWQNMRYRCEAEHILTPEKIRIIKETFTNVRLYLQRLLKVIPLSQPIKLTDFQPFLDHTRYDRIGNIDLYMAITSRPRVRGDATLASAGAVQLEELFYRPTQGGVYLNPAAIPDEAQNENSVNSKFFYVCVHEIFHALGIASYHFEHYHPYENRRPFSNPICKLSVKGKQMTFLTTPYARKYAKKHYGVTTFKGDNGKTCPAGIEIEDGGGQGTAGSHLEERTFMSELMTGVTIQTENGPFNRLTDASMAILQDTGNYKVNYRVGQPLVWGNPESINGRPIPNFATGPWQLVFPEGYVYNRTYPHETGFDYKFFGPRQLARAPTCSYYSNDAYCKGKGFYNPTNGDIGTQPVFDYMPFKYPNNVCPRGKAMIPTTMMDGSVQKCGEYVCHGYNSFTFRNYDKLYAPHSYTTITCDRSTIGKKMDAPIWLSDTRYYRRTLTCPDPERFCRSVRLNEMHFTNDPFDDNTHLLDSDDGTLPNATVEEPTIMTVAPDYDPEATIFEADENEETTTKDPSDNAGKKGISAMTIIFIMGGVIGLLVIIIIAILFVLRHKTREPDSDDVLQADLTTQYIV